MKADLTILRDARYYLGFPDPILFADGSLGIAYVEHPLEVLRGHGANLAHAGVGRRNGALRSTDGGRTWTKLGSWPASRVEQLANGDLLGYGMRWETVGDPAQLVALGLGPIRPLPEGLWTASRGPFTVRSTDGGATWEPSVRWLGLPNWAPYGDLVELGNGRVAMSVDGPSENGVSRRARLLESDDWGRTWRPGPVVADDPSATVDFVEPTVARLVGGRLVAMLRTNDRRLPDAEKAISAAYLYQAVSDDGGRTWDMPRDTGIWGHPAHLLALRDGRLLCTYGYRRAPFGVRAVVSADGGATWRAPRVLRDDGGHWDLGYPRSVQLPDGTIFTTYYLNHALGPPFLAASRYAPDWLDAAHG